MRASGIKWARVRTDDTRLKTSLIGQFTHPISLTFTVSFSSCIDSCFTGSSCCEKSLTKGDTETEHSVSIVTEMSLRCASSDECAAAQGLSDCEIGSHLRHFDNDVIAKQACFNVTSLFVF